MSISSISRGLLLCLISWAALAKPIDVVFLNPGKTGEPFWSSYSAFMQQAASRLNIRLEIITAERNHIRQLEQAREVFHRPRKPDYVLLVNEKQIAETLINEADAAGIKVMLAHVRLEREQAHRLSLPRMKRPHWIGEIVPDNERSGFVSMQAMLAQALPVLRANRLEPKLLVLNGTLSTMVAPDRRQGMIKALLAERLKPVSWEYDLDWSRDEARKSVLRALQLNPDINLLWAANNAMALGAVDAAQEMGRKPGKDIWIAGAAVGVLAAEAPLLKSGVLSATAGGQFFNGGWAMVMLRQHADGHDFARFGQVNFVAGVTPALTAANIEQWQPAFEPAQWARFDFAKRFPVQCAGRYQFQPELLLNQAVGCAR